VTLASRCVVVSGMVLIVWSAVLAQQLPTPASSEQERWDRLFNAQPSHIRWEPNEFLMDVVAKRQPGEALDIGMGSGRNALFLARSGWRVTGFDISSVGVTRAKEQAAVEKLPLTALREDMFTFDYGSDRYDLVILMYMGRAEALGQRITDAMKPGGLLVVEHFAGGFEPGSLTKVFPRLEVLRYTEDDAYPDYDQRIKGRVVRFLARKAP
jgi:predicted TPR repeat methyltransferase